MATQAKATRLSRKLKESAASYSLIDTVLVGDSWTVARSLLSSYVQCIVTSPPYFGHREYSDNEKLIQFELGREEDPSAYVGKLVFLFEELRRVLRDDGTLWLNLRHISKRAVIGYTLARRTGFAGCWVDFAKRDNLE